MVSSTQKRIISESKLAGGCIHLVIPAVVMSDPKLSMSARMLHGLIVWRCGNNDTTWQSNRALGEDLGLTEKTVSRLVSELRERGHIATEIIYREGSKEVERRYIRPLAKCNHPIPETGDTPPLKNEEENIKRGKKTKYPPKSPKGENCRRTSADGPAWQPAQFEELWASYPRGAARQAAIRAWDKLRPSDELIDTMTTALSRQLESEAWQRGVGIPYLVNWLRDQRWTDELDRNNIALANDGLIENEEVYLL